MGMIALRDIGAKTSTGSLIVPTIAGRLDLFVTRQIPHVIELEGTAQLMFNSGSNEFVYVVPDRIADQVRAIQARRLGVDPSQVNLPALVAVDERDGHLVVVVPNAPPHIDGIADVTPGPFFLIQIGDPTESPGVGGPADPNGNGLVDARITLLDTIQLTGDARIVVSGDGFTLLTSAQARLALPGAENLFRSSVAGVLTISRAGLFGAIGATSNIGLTINNVTLGTGLQAFVGINTTNTDQSLNMQIAGFTNPVLAARSAAVNFKGGITIGGFGLIGGSGSPRVHSRFSLESMPH